MSLKRINEQVKPDLVEKELKRSVPFAFNWPVKLIKNKQYQFYGCGRL